MLMLMALLTLAAAVAIILGGLYVISELNYARTRPGWRRLPSRPGLPPEMEYQLWTHQISGFSASALSDAVADAVRVLSPLYGRATVYGALKGARILVYVPGTYPGDRCTPVVLTSSVPQALRSAAVEENLCDVAHALAHLVERQAGRGDTVSHRDWDAKGLSTILEDYVRRCVQRAERAA